MHAIDRRTALGLPRHVEQTFRRYLPVRPAGTEASHASRVRRVTSRSSYPGLARPEACAARAMAAGWPRPPVISSPTCSHASRGYRQWDVVVPHAGSGPGCSVTPRSRRPSSLGSCASCSLTIAVARAASASSVVTPARSPCLNVSARSEISTGMVMSSSPMGCVRRDRRRWRVLSRAASSDR